LTQPSILQTHESYALTGHHFNWFTITKFSQFFKINISHVLTNALKKAKIFDLIKMVQFTHHPDIKRLYSMNILVKVQEIF
jgi:hypothetical protein